MKIALGDKEKIFCGDGGDGSCAQFSKNIQVTAAAFSGAATSATNPYTDVIIHFHTYKMGFFESRFTFDKC